MIQENIRKLNELQELISVVHIEDFTSSDEVLSGSTIGQHIRHILEFYICLSNGAFSGVVCYDDRKRDVRIEQEKKYALSAIENILVFLNSVDLNETLYLKASHGNDLNNSVQLNTSMGREVAFTLDHMIHHLAILKIALNQKGYKLDQNLGVADSTIKHRKAVCAQ